MPTTYNAVPAPSCDTCVLHACNWTYCACSVAVTEDKFDSLATGALVDIIPPSFCNSPPRGASYGSYFSFLYLSCYVVCVRCPREVAIDSMISYWKYLFEHVLALRTAEGPTRGVR